MINASWIVFSTDSIKMHKNQHTRKEWDEKMKIQCLRCLYCQKEQRGNYMSQMDMAFMEKMRTYK